MGTDRGLAVWCLWAKYTATFLLERFRKWHRLQVEKLHTWPPMGGHHSDRVLLGEQSVGRVSVATCLVWLGTFAQCTIQELGSFQRPCGRMRSRPFQVLEALPALLCSRPLPSIFTPSHSLTPRVFSHFFVTITRRRSPLLEVHMIRLGPPG